MEYIEDYMLTIKADDSNSNSWSRGYIKEYGVSLKDCVLKLNVEDHSTTQENIKRFYNFGF